MERRSTSTPTPTPTPTSDTTLQSLISRGWCFRSPEQVHDIMKQLTVSVEAEARPGPKGEVLVDLVESELLSMDLRSFGGESLPDASTLKKRTSLQGPKVLQVVSVRDISLSSNEASFKNSQPSRRLLRFVLTDGTGEVTAVEYAQIPAIKKVIVPGTKVRLENRIVVQNGMLCLDPKVFTVMGGFVQSLLEEWEMDQKYSGISRLNLKPSHNSEGAGPPPFEKLRLEGHNLQSHCGQPNLGSKGFLPSNFADKQGQDSHIHRTNEKGRPLNKSTFDDVNDNTEVTSTSNKIEGNMSTSEARSKEVIEAMPVQNQAAARKLLQKMSQPNFQDRYHRGNRHRGKGKQEEAPVFTLDEWERKKTGTSKPAVAGEMLDVSRDEELAWQLQQQLDLEDSHLQARHQTEAEKIRMNMFSFEKAEERKNGRRGGSRGRGRGRTFG